MGMCRFMPAPSIGLAQGPSYRWDLSGLDRGKETDTKYRTKRRRIEPFARRYQEAP